MLVEQQVKVLRRLHFPRRVNTEMTQCDREYDSVACDGLCDTLNIKNHFLTTNDHKANGLFKNANRTLPSFSIYFVRVTSVV